MKIILNEKQSKILLEIAVKDLLPKEMAKRKKEKLESKQVQNNSEKDVS
jgi:hypothetical protein